MADAPPPGPPPPRVPEGWKAVYNTQYNEWFYVNKFTKVSQWDKPTEPAVDPNARGESSPPGPPPAYIPSSGPAPVENEKQNPNNPYTQTHGKTAQEEEDARLAAQLQAEENARAASGHGTTAGGGSARGAADSYYQSSGGNNSYGSPGQQQYGAQQQHNNYPSSPVNSPGFAPPQQQSAQVAGGGSDAKRGFMSKLLGKSSHPPQGQYQQGYGQQYPPQGQYYGQGYPPQGGYYGGPQYQQAPPRKSGGGLGAGGGALLGAGAGLVGGALLMDAFEDHQQFDEQQAYQQGEDQGYDQGYDAGNDDMGGGDF